MEIDEFYVNAGDKGFKKKNSRRRQLKKRGRGTYESERPPTITVYCRNEKRVCSIVEKNLSKSKIWSIIDSVGSENIHLNTDEYTIYDSIKYHPKVSNHSTVNHALKEYSNNKSHVNHCECFHQPERSEGYKNR